MRRNRLRVTRVMSVAVRRDHPSRLMAVAHRLERSRSEIVRELIEDFLRRYELAPPGGRRAQAASEATEAAG